MTLAGIGDGRVIAALFSFALAAVGDREIGSASGVLTAVQAVGGSVGVAVSGSVFFDQVKTGDFTTGFHHALIVQAGLLMAFLAIAFFLPRKSRPDEEQHGITPGGLPRLRRRTPHRLTWAGRWVGSVDPSGLT
ncbi:MFS transporter [Streptomyces goshikiensis]|uniref:hypothetical protein n=1 Tax=Streptomyces goshikiensis TaxID=1942 RepID=UPI00380DF892